MWTSADEYCERKMQEERNNNVEYLQEEIKRLKEIIKNKDTKLEEITRAVIWNCRPAEDIVKEIYDIVFNKKKNK